MMINLKQIYVGGKENLQKRSSIHNEKQHRAKLCNKQKSDRTITWYLNCSDSTYAMNKNYRQKNARNIQKERSSAPPQMNHPQKID